MYPCLHVYMDAFALSPDDMKPKMRQGRRVPCEMMTGCVTLPMETLASMQLDLKPFVSKLQLERANYFNSLPLQCEFHWGPLLHPQLAFVIFFWTDDMINSQHGTVGERVVSYN